jgi:cell division protein FtsL
MSIAPVHLPRPETRSRAHLKVAPEVARRRRLTRLAMFGAAVVTVASLFLMVAFQVFAAQSAFRLDHLAKQRSNEELRNQRLREQVAQLSSPGSVFERARQDGLVQVPVAYVQAPLAAPKKPVTDRAQAMLQGSWSTTKLHLDDGNP